MLMEVHIMEKFAIVYYLPNQSKLSSTPQIHHTNNIAALNIDISLAVKNGYEIVYAGPTELVDALDLYY